MSDWKKEVEELLSEQLRIEHFASYFYRSCYGYAMQRKVSLLNLACFFDGQAKEELDHANGIIDYMNAKEYKITYKEIEIPSTDYKSVVDVFEKSYLYERVATKHILKIYGRAEENNDFGLTQFLDPYVEEQIKAEKEFDDFLTNAKRCDSELGLFIFDQAFKK